MPRALALDPRAQRLYVLNEFADPRGNGSIDVLKADDSGEKVGTFPLTTNPPYPTAQRPLALALDPRARRLYVLYDHANGADVHAPGAVWVVDTGAGRVRRKAPVGHAPDALLVDTHTGHVFVANAGDNTVSMLDAAHL